MAQEWLEDLNPQQRAAATHGAGPLLIVAGAGTGKTKTLACRVACLIERGVDPGRILLLTFTRRAAAEMIGRARHFTEGKAANKVWGGTFHATANRLLRVYGSSVGLPADFTVMDAGDAADLMNMIRNDLGVAKGDRRFPKKATLVKVYSYTVNAQIELTRVLDRHFPWCGDDRDAMAQIFDEYTRRKRRQHVLDYDDLLLYWRALTAVPRVGEAVAGRFDHILVDEYQDTNSIQAEILRGMCKAHDNIVVVGDDAQSIYAFRAATIRNILDFPKQFPGTTVVTLEQNYRSIQPILDASNAVMSQAKEHYTKDLWSNRRSALKPVLMSCEDESEQTAAVSRNILAHFEDGVPLMQQAVLFRASHHSADLEVDLARRNIPFHKFGGLKFIETAHIKDVLACLRIIENPYDQLSWFRVLQLLDGIGPKTAQGIIAELGAGAGGESPGAHGGGGRSRADCAPGAISTPIRCLLDRPPAVPQSARERFTDLRKAVAACTGVTLGRPRGAEGESELSAARKPTVAEQIEVVASFYTPICKNRYENSAVRLRDLEQLEQIARKYRSRGRFITALTLDPPSSTSDLAGKPSLDDDYLTLSTIHSAKGCEWTVVHILHAADGMIPSDLATGDEAGVDEERRLFYVAMTRAKDHLYVYFPHRYYHQRFGHADAHGYAQLTRFLFAEARALFVERTEEFDGDYETDPTSAGSRFEVRVDHLWKS